MYHFVGSTPTYGKLRHFTCSVCENIEKPFLLNISLTSRMFHVCYVLRSDFHKTQTSIHESKIKGVWTSDCDAIAIADPRWTAVMIYTMSEANLFFQSTSTGLLCAFLPHESESTT